MYVGLMFLLWWSDISPISVCGVSVFAYCGGVILVLQIYVAFQRLPSVVK